jgi:hypothetical protein
MLQVTLNTSLQLHGRTTELPWSDFNRQVTRFTRHTLQLKGFRSGMEAMIATCKQRFLVDKAVVQIDGAPGDPGVLHVDDFLNFESRL